MMLRLALAGLMCCAIGAQAGWQFSAPIDVLEAQTGVFPHLESSNRQGIAESGGIVAVAWQDNRQDAAQCHVRFKKLGDIAFVDEVTLEKDCAEPVVIGLGDGRFVTGWAAQGNVWAALLAPGALSKPVKLNHAEAGQVTLAYDPKGGLHAAWVEQASSGHLQLWEATLDNGQDGLKLAYSHTVENIIPIEDQTYPALVVNPDGSVVVVWEDRRFDHTVMLVSYSHDGKRFDLPYRLIDVHGNGPGIGGAARYGGGMGAMRPTLAPCGAASTEKANQPASNFCVIALWMDKRDFLSGYDVYAAFSQNGGKSFGRNLKVQDSFGDNIAQWHGDVAANRKGVIAAVWDDDRDGNSDLWLAPWNGTEFGDNIAVPGASGPGLQTDPMDFMDDAGRLHIIWLDRADEDTSPRIRYVSGVWKD